MSETTEMKPVPEYMRAPRADQMALLEILATTLNALHATGYSFYSYNSCGSTVYGYLPVITDKDRKPSPGLVWSRPTKRKPGPWRVVAPGFTEPESRRSA